MSQKRLSAYIERLYGVQENIERKLQEKKAQEADKFKMSGTDFEAVPDPRTADAAWLDGT